MFEWDEDEKKVDFSHNPFSMPQGGLEALENQDPLTINAFQYDIVCNGFELSSGAIRNHRPEIMKKAFDIAGYDEAVLYDKFGGMLRAMEYGAPPHGGIAPGHRPDCDAVVWRRESARSDSIPHEPAGRRFVDGCAIRRFRAPAARIAYPLEFAERIGNFGTEIPETASQGAPFCYGLG